MKRMMVAVLTLCLMSVIAWAGVPTKDASVLPSKAPVMDSKAELQNILDQIAAAKAAGLEPSAELYARCAELQPAAPRNTLDQGNDVCPATVIASLPYSDNGSTAGLANDYNPGTCITSSAPDVIYEYTAVMTGVHTISLCGSSFDTGLGVWTGASCPGDVNVACNDDFCGVSSQVAPELTAGVTYWIVVDGYSSNSGNYVLNVTGPYVPMGRCCYGNVLNPTCGIMLDAECADLGGTFTSGITSCDANPCPIPAPGETCASALPLTVPGTVTGSTVGAVNDYDETCPYSGSLAGDLVYSYTPAADQQVTFDLCASGYDTKVYIYDGECGGDPIACNDDFCPDYRSFLGCVQLLGGHTYYVVVDGYGGDEGDYSMTTVVCEVIPPPANDNAANAELITVNGAQVCATTAGATFDCDLNDFPEVWYTFTTDGCMDIAVAYCGTVTSGSLLGILYGGSACGTLIWYNSYEYTTCADGLITLYFVNLPAGQYWLPVGFNPAGPFCVQVLGTACPPSCEELCASEANTFCNLEGGPINDVSMNSFAIEVPIQYHITDVNVCLDLVHTFDGDLVISLVDPSGGVVYLSSNRGGGGDNFTCTRFDDEVVNPIGGGSAPFTGIFTPDAPLSLCDGGNAMGTWWLNIEDIYGGDEGFLNWCCISFEYDDILAVNLADFAAVAGDSRITLNWSTASETNNDYFEVVRDGEALARVDATNDATGSSYSWTDGSVANGTTYTYTLVAVDVNGVRQEVGSVEATPSFGAGAVTEYALHGNYPNPFNPTTTISFDLLETGFTTLKIYNLMGQEVALVVNGNLPAGRYNMAFDAKDLPSGAYLYRLESGSFSAVKKMLLLK